MVNELSARFFDLHLVCVSPYRPAACLRPHFEAEYMTAPDHRLPAPFKRPLASTGASIHDLMGTRLRTRPPSPHWGRAGAGLR